MTGRNSGTFFGNRLVWFVMAVIALMGAGMLVMSWGDVQTPPPADALPQVDVHEEDTFAATDAQGRYLALPVDTLVAINEVTRIAIPECENGAPQILVVPNQRNPSLELSVSREGDAFWTIGVVHGAEAGDESPTVEGARVMLKCWVGN